MARQTKRRTPPARHRSKAAKPALDWFDDVISLLVSRAEADRTESATEAAGLWIGYAMLAEAIECHPSATKDAKRKLRSDLDYAHYQAAACLMVEAERVGLNASPLSEERRVCQELPGKTVGTSQRLRRAVVSPPEMHR